MNLQEKYAALRNKIEETFRPEGFSDFSQARFNLIYCLLISALLLCVFVFFPATKLRYWNYLEFDSAKGDHIEVDPDSRMEYIPSRVLSAHNKISHINYAEHIAHRKPRSKAMYGAMEIHINNKVWRCGCVFEVCTSEAWFNNPPYSGIPDSDEERLHTTIIDSLTILHVDRRNQCLVLDMKYLGVEYSIDPKRRNYLFENKDALLNAVEHDGNVLKRVISIFLVFGAFLGVAIKNIHERRVLRILN